MNKREDSNIAKYKDNFVIRFFRHIKNFFKKEEKINKVEKHEKNESYIYENNIKDNMDFKDDIIIKKSDEEIRILELQKQYKAGKILEEDMTEEDHEKLIELYKEQNKQLEEKIIIKKNKIRKRLNELKSS